MRSQDETDHNSDSPSSTSNEESQNSNLSIEERREMVQRFRAKMYENQKDAIQRAAQNEADSYLKYFKFEVPPHIPPFEEDGSGGDISWDLELLGIN